MKPLSNMQHVDFTKDANLMLPDMEDIPVIARHGLGGAALGGGAAALLSLIHNMKLERQLGEEQRKLDNPETDEDTIVLRMPGKAASEKRANDPATFAAAWLAALGGGTGAYALVRKLYHNNLMGNIKDKEEAARTTLLNDLTTNKEADEKRGGTFGPIDAPIGMGMLLALLGTGATGYLTKKVLDEQFKSVDRKNYEAPKVKRIVFQPQPAEEDEKVAEEEIDAIRAITIVHMMKGSNDYTAFEDAGLKRAMEAVEMDKQAVLDMASHPQLQTAITSMLGNDDIRGNLQRAYMSDHPILKYFKWATKVPGLRSLADKAMYSKLGLQPQQKVAFISGPGIASSLLGSMMAKQVDSVDNDPSTPDITPGLASDDSPELTPEDTAEKVQIEGTDDGTQEYVDDTGARIRAALAHALAQ